LSWVRFGEALDKGRTLPFFLVVVVFEAPLLVLLFVSPTSALAGFLILIAMFQTLVQTRRPHEPTLREGVLWLVFFVALAVAVGLAFLAVLGASAAISFVGEYLNQYTFAVDAVFLAIGTLEKFGIPRGYRQKVLVIAIPIGLVIRTGMALGGWFLTERWVSIIFYSAAAYAFKGLLALRPEAADESVDPIKIRLMRRHLPMTVDLYGSQLFVRQRGLFLLTPMVLVILAIALSDMLFIPEPGNPAILISATTLALLLVGPLQPLVSHNVLADGLRIGRVLAAVLALNCIKLLLTGAAAVHVTRIGSVHLPTAFASSSWVSVILALIVTTAIVRSIFGWYRRRREDASESA
jgi:tellurite resistance protein TerC